MSTLSPNAPPFEPRRFPIRLAQLAWILAATLMLGLVTAALRVGLPIYRQHLAVKEIERVEGYVSAKKLGPAWLRRWLGAEPMKSLDEIRFVSVPSEEFDDTGLAKIGALKSTTRLNLSGTQITDGGLARIADFKALRRLDLSRTQITDAGLKHLQRLTNLQELLL